MLTHDVQHLPRFIDLHQDMLSGVLRLEGDLSGYGSKHLTGSTHAAAVWSSLYPHEPEASLLGQLDALAELLREHDASLRLITTVGDLDSEDPRVGVLPHSEGFHLPGVEVDTLQWLWSERALRSLALTWNYETEYGYSCYEDAAAHLKPVGRELVKALDRTPLLLDLAHLNDAGFFDALELYEAPVLVTHTFSRTVAHHPRGLSDDQLRALGEHGGLVGLAFDPDFLGQGTVDEAMRHLDRIASLAGETAVSIGSDWGVAAMGELSGPESLLELLDAVRAAYGEDLADRFALANAFEFLHAQLPRD